MSGEVGGAGLVQRVVAAVPLPRLQRIAEAWLLVSVVDDERCSALRRNPLGEGTSQRFPRRCAFDDGTGRRAPEPILNGDRIRGSEAECLG